jgi:fatty-acyl-CoA synthase
VIHGNWLAKWARFVPHKAAIIDLATGRKHGYAELNARADRMANLLRDGLGTKPGDRVAILAQNRVEQVELFFAVAKLGAILVPVNWRLTTPEIAYILENSAPSVLLYGQELASVVEELHARQLSSGEPLWRGQAIALDGPGGDGLDARLAAASDRPVETEGITEATPLLLLYTSGTTGRPKGAVLTHGSITWNAIITATCWDLRHDDVTLTHTPFFHTGGWNVLTLPLLHRGATVVLAAGSRFDPGETLRAVDEQGITILFAVPTMFQMMLDHEAMATTRFVKTRYFIAGGAPCPVPLIEAFQRRGVVFKQGFGLTEVGPNCFVLDACDAVSKAGSVGHPVLHLDTRVVDQASLGREIEPGEVGELQLRGPTVCAGYWRDEEAAAAARTPDGWFRTGDLFRRDAEGYHYVVGRLKEMYISGGENVYPAEIERVLYEVPGVVEAAVVGVPHPKWGEVGHAFVACSGARRPAAEELLAHCRAHLAKYKVPKALTLLDSLPKGMTGKIQKSELAAMAASMVEAPR